ncbi:MAG: hypothetical protein KDA85_14640, partial [Planctomycetaceae bacterium]|nr:hypothetical protein [Planctomycetaceae bacterium]
GWGYNGWGYNGWAGANPWNCYTPMYPYAAAPRPVLPPPAWSGYQNPCCPPIQLQCPPAPCPPPVCEPVCPQPITVRVPVTTYRSVTVDQGHWQRVWVSRPVTQCVPETTWQYQQISPGGGYGMQMMPPATGMMPSQPMAGNCGSTPCQTGTTSMMSGYPTAATAIPGRMTTQQTYSPGMMTARRPPLFPGDTGNSYSPTTAWSSGSFRTAWNSATPMPYNTAPQMSYNMMPQTAQPYSSMNSTLQPTPWQVVPAPAVAGDIMGDHEMIPSQTAMSPVQPNAFRGTAPIRQISWGGSRIQPVRGYPNSVR